MPDRDDGAPKAHHLRGKAVSQSLDAIFEPFEDSDDPVECQNAITGLLNLTGIYLETHGAVPLLKSNAIRCDTIGASEAIMRFQRDVWGLHRFYTQLKKLKLPQKSEQTILEWADKLGLRINSEKPLKTRIAASFSLWMTTFRPISVDPEKAAKFYKRQHLTYCNASIVHWISCAFLDQYGKVNHGDDPDAGKRIERIRYDFTYRNLTLSSLEMLYCSIYRPK